MRLATTAGLWALVGLCGLRAEVPGHWTYVDLDGAARAFAACDNVTAGGTISASTKGCANPTFQPPRLTDLTAPTGGSGAIEYLWMRTTADPASGQPVSWQTIAGSDGADYTPSPITQTTYYMRCSRRAGCTKWAGETNYVTIEIDCCQNVTAGGTISGDQTHCGIPYDPSLLGNVAPATGGANALVYTWYSSATATTYSPGSPEWTVVGSVTTPYFNPGPISVPTRYVRVAQRALCSAPGAWSNVVTVNAFAPPSLKADVVDVTCAGQADGSASVTILNAASPFTYRWMDNGSQALVRSNLQAGRYQFELTDANGCTVIEEVVVAQPSALTATAAATFDACSFADDAVVTATATGGTPPYSYAWSSGETTATLTGKPAGRYTLNVTDASGCTATAQADVAPPARLAGTLDVTQPTCSQANGAIAVTTVGGTAPYSYTWTPATATGSNPSGLAGGTYSVRVDDAAGCSFTLSAELDATPALAVTLAGQDLTCNGVADGRIVTTVTGGRAPFTYVWADGASTADRNGLSEGTYRLTVTDARGCTATATATIARPAALALVLDVTQPICHEDGGTIAGIITGGTAPYVYTWGTAGLNAQQTHTNLPAGSYTVTVTDAGGCSVSASATIEATVLLQLSTTSTDASCPSEPDGSASVAIAGGAAPYTIRWSDAAAQNTATATGLTPGEYGAQITDSRGCTRFANVIVGMRSTGPQATAQLTELDCVGATDAAIDLTVAGGLAPYTFAWADGPATEDRSGLAAGTYVVTVTDAAGCTTEQTYTFVAPEALTCRVAPTSTYPDYFHVSAFGARDGAAAATVTGGSAPYTYRWSGGATTAAASGLPGGTVAVTVTDAKGCTCTHDTTLVEPSMIADFVWEDLNGDGIQDAGEPGLPGISIRINGRDFNNRVVDFNTISDAQGQYRFDRLPIGNYTLSFRLSGNQDYFFSPANQGGNDARDSDMDPVLLQAMAIVTAHGIGNYDLDAGFIPRTSLITIGDAVWYDADHDGLRDTYESGVAGVSMRLYRKADDALLSTVVSNEDGDYSFLDVTAGTYYITVDPSTSAIASAFVASVANAGGDDDLDSDFDPLTNRSSDIVVTAASTVVTNLDLGLHEDCPTVSTAGTIAGTEDVCVGQRPMVITSLAAPAGAVKYQWYRSNGSVYAGPNDPRWTRIAGATGVTYHPGIIATTVYYIRLASDAACGADYTGASNVVVKRAVAAPAVALASAVSSDGGTNNGRTMTMCQNAALTVTADSTAPNAFVWDFGAGATPTTAAGRVAAGVTFATTGARFVYLTVTSPQGCVGRDSFLVNTIACAGPGQVGGVEGYTQGGSTTVSWSAISLATGSTFAIERATGEGTFTRIATQPARALGAWEDYTYVDAFAPSGKTRYRITHFAPHTGEAHSVAVTLDVTQVALRAEVYPNPARETLHVAVALAEQGPVEYQLITSLGAVLRRGTLEAGVTAVDVADLPAGTYYLQTVSPSGATDVRPVVKQR